MPQEEKEFILQQYYKVTVDASLLDKNDSVGSEADLAKEDTARNHRMFQAIIQNEKALHAVFEYKVIKEHALDLDSSYAVEEFTKDHYGETLEFAHILTRFLPIFTQEDREYLQEIIKADQEADGEYDLGVETEHLEDCFKVKASGWNIKGL